MTPTLTENLFPPITHDAQRHTKWVCLCRSTTPRGEYLDYLDEACRHIFLKFPCILQRSGLQSWHLMQSICDHVVSLVLTTQGRDARAYRITALPHYRITALPWHRIVHHRRDCNN